MDNAGFETALTARVDEMLDACTKCGACFTACPIAGPAGPRRRRPGGRGVRRARHPAVRQRPGGIREMGQGLHGQRRVHQGLRLRRQPALPADDGAARHDAERRRTLAERRKQGVNVFRKIGEDVSVLSRLQLSEEALIRLGQRPSKEPRARRAAGRGVLHRLQRAQDAAHRAALPRHHGHDRHRLSGDGRPDPLLRHQPASRRRHRHARRASPTTPSTSCRSRRPSRCWRGARAASCSSARPCCRPSSARPARCRST